MPIREFESLKKEMDDRLKSFGERIASIDKKFEDKIKLVDDVHKSKDDWKSTLDKSYQILFSKIDDLKTYVDSNSKSLSDLKLFLYESKQEILKLQKDYGDIKDILYCRSKDIQSLLSKYENIADEFASLYSMLKDCFKKDGEEFGLIRKSLEVLYIESTKNKQDVQEVKEKIHQSLAFYEKNSREVELLLKTISTLKDRIEQVNHETLSEVAAAKDFLLSVINSEMEEIFIPDVSHFVKDSDMDKLRHEIDLCNLDSKNACAKSSNIEMQTAINSKKIESLQLKITQLELKNQ